MYRNTEHTNNLIQITASTHTVGELSFDCPISPVFCEYVNADIQRNTKRTNNLLQIDSLSLSLSLSHTHTHTHVGELSFPCRFSRPDVCKKNS